jgi:hypothetical protein
MNMSSVVLAARLCLSPPLAPSHLGFCNAAQLQTRGTGGLMVYLALLELEQGDGLGAWDTSVVISVPNECLRLVTPCEIRVVIQIHRPGEDELP